MAVNVASSNFIKIFIPEIGSICTLLVDSGADISLFKIEKLQNLRKEIKNDSINFTGVGQENFSSLGTCEITLNLTNNCHVHHKFHLISNDFSIPFDGILGRDFLKFFQCSIDYYSYLLHLTLQGETISIPLYDRVDEGTIILPSRSEVVRRVDAVLTGDSVIIGEEVAPGVFSSSSIVNNIPVVSFLNTTEKDVILRDYSPKVVPLQLYHVVCSKSGIENLDEQRITSLFNELNFDNVPSYALESIQEICVHFNDIFCLPGDKVTFNNFYKQSIKCSQTEPVYVKNYRIPHAQSDEIQKQVTKMLHDGIIEPSTSPYNSPILLVPKKSENDEKKWRLVVDYRKVNNSIIADKFPLPRIDEILDQLGRAKFFTILDLQAGFHQILINPDDHSREITAFTACQGHFQFTRLPFGLKISPNSFQRMMSLAMSGLSPESTFLYIDDLVVFGASLAHHNSNLIKVFKRLRQFNLKLNPNKCKFLQNEVVYLGHRLTPDGVLPDSSKFNVVHNYPIPKNPDDVRRFVAFANYYRKFIKNFAEKATPLNNLLRKKTKFLWDSTCQSAFDSLKADLTSPRVLKYPDFTKPFLLTTDASDIAASAILSQGEIGEDLPIAYASKAFTKGEKNKSTIEKELTAIHWGVKHFRPYLFGRSFKIITDHKPLVYLFNMKNPSSKLMRMRLDLEEYDFTIMHRPGKDNGNADALSRIEIDSDTLKSLTILPVQTRGMARKEKEPNIQNLLESIDFSDQLEPDQLKVHEVSKLSEILNCPELIFYNSPSDPSQSTYGGKSALKKYNTSKYTVKISANYTELAFEQDLLIADQSCKDLKIRELSLSLNSLIFQHFTVETFKTIANKKLQHLSILLYTPPILITDKSAIKDILNQNHISPLGGHVGQNRLLKKLKELYRWRGMGKDIAEYVKSCESCQRNKSSVLTKEPMVLTSTPQSSFDIVSIDTIGPFIRSNRGNRYALTMQCDLTKFICIVAIPDKEANTIARALTENFILKYGIMKCIKSDMGTEFLNEVFHRVCEMLQINQVNSTPYHHQTLGGIERNHKTLNEYLRSYINEHGDDWDSWLSYFEFCYNTTPTIHNYSPFQLIYGKKARLPQNLMNDNLQPIYNFDLYSAELQHKLQNSWNFVRKTLYKDKIVSKKYYDRNKNPSDFSVNDLVLLKNFNIKKLESLYQGPFRIIDRLGVNSKIMNLNNGKIKMVHNNLLKLYHSNQ